MHVMEEAQARLTAPGSCSSGRAEVLSNPGALGEGEDGEDNRDGWERGQGMGHSRALGETS